MVACQKGTDAQKEVGAAALESCNGLRSDGMDHKNYASLDKSEDNRTALDEPAHPASPTVLGDANPDEAAAESLADDAVSMNVGMVGQAAVIELPAHALQVVTLVAVACAAVDLARGLSNMQAVEWCWLFHSGVTASYSLGTWLLSLAVSASPVLLSRDSRRAFSENSYSKTEPHTQEHYIHTSPFQYGPSCEDSD